jgi:hypothetical protein
MNQWLKCKVSHGQFSNEFAIQGKLFDGTGFSLFAEKEDVRFEKGLEIGQTVDGFVRVDILQEVGDLYLLSLPKPTMQNSPFITVEKGEVE